jgi:hypothetical protein
MEYKNSDGTHKKKGNYGFLGTPHFGSISALDGNTLGRRDDLECLGYTLIYLLDKENFPFANI